MGYLTYNDYIAMGGGLDEAAFHRYSFMAKKEIDRETFGRIKSMPDVPEAVRMLTFELIQVNAKGDLSEESVTSESVSGWSKSFKDVSKEDFDKERMRLILSYLSDEYDDQGTPLLYRGC